ncbi:hypothetical protein K4H40_11570 [Clostridium chauvoei]|uniref:ABC transporter permease n=2 Tax=Clostridium chauvoei TaxID=46867 RepID=A0A1U6J482_9CLOT|nr:solute carrier family 23 protein [Clostridium chauvoei]MBX7281530.1 hypothetical protein [Clostridium chauvoei]MBX7284050.1 hypothetical protein [Clostridium chauvoei]MBX7286578.1 hypothetical protein [Clostridium chauvoei]MBX7289098.1 hypothetical protein [Clostridium chauvoei]MBX7291614.1 hypothetical protein [Clostridium chauvoei]
MAQYVEVKESYKSESLKKGLRKGILGIQHLIAMFGATVLVPMITGLDISVALFSIV